MATHQRLSSAGDVEAPNAGTRFEAGGCLKDELGPIARECTDPRIDGLRLGDAPSVEIRQLACIPLRMEEKMMERPSGAHIFAKRPDCRPPPARQWASWSSFAGAKMQCKRPKCLFGSWTFSEAVKMLFFGVQIRKAILGSENPTGIFPGIRGRNDGAGLRNY